MKNSENNISVIHLFNKYLLGIEIINKLKEMSSRFQLIMSEM